MFRKLIIGAIALSCFGASAFAQATPQYWLVARRPDRAVAVFVDANSIESTGEGRVVAQVDTLHAPSHPDLPNMHGQTVAEYDCAAQTWRMRQLRESGEAWRDLPEYPMAPAQGPALTVLLFVCGRPDQRTQLGVAVPASATPLDYAQEHVFAARH